MLSVGGKGFLTEKGKSSTRCGKMVWWLEAVDSSAPGNFYFTEPGTYTVGRKDCAIVIQTDKTISRLHAEFYVEAAPPQPTGERDFENLPRCKISLKDASKFGTFVNKKADSKPLNSLSDSTRLLQEGDNITFGINKVAFRLRYLRIMLCMSSAISQRATDVIPKMAALGIYAFEDWNDQCTHLLVEDNSLVDDLVIAAVVSQKPVVLLDWIQFFKTEKSPISQIPNLSSYPAVLKMDSSGHVLPFPIAEPLARRDTLSGYTVLLEEGCPYRSRCLRAFVNIAGGVVTSFTRENLKGIAGSMQSEHGLLVFPANRASCKDWLGSTLSATIRHLPSMSEESLIRTILSAKLDPPAIDVGSVAMADSDETVDEEDPEALDGADSSRSPDNVQVTGVRLPEYSQAHQNQEQESADIRQPNTVLQTESVWKSKSSSSIPLNSVNKSILESYVSAEPINQRGPLASAEHHKNADVKTEEGALLFQASADIIFKKDLMIRNSGNEVSVTEAALPNFKRFKKGPAVQGNSFTSLVPFAKEPYRDSDYARELGEYMKQEKKRKQAEAAADDLFSTEQLKRRKVSAAKEAGPSIFGGK